MNIVKQTILIFITTLFFCFNIGYGQIIKTETVLGIDISHKTKNTNYPKVSLISCDTIFSFQTRHWPSGLTWDGINLWYVDTAFIHKVNSLGVHLDSIANPSMIDDTVGGGLTFDGINLWYADEQSAQLFKINPLTGGLLQQFNLPSFGQTDPNGFGLTWDGINLWHSQYRPFKLYKINPANGIPVLTYSTPRGLVDIEYINGNLFGMSVNKIFKIDTATGLFQDSTSWCIPFSLGLAWDGLYMWNVSGDDNVFGIPTGGHQKIYKINSDFILAREEYTNKKSEMNLFPNPNNGNMTLECNLNMNEKGVFTIYDITGKLVGTYLMKENSQTLSIDAESLKPGIYLYEIIVNDKKVKRDKFTIFK